MKTKPPRTAPRVVIVDDHAILRIGLTALLRQGNNFIVCGVAENAAAALQVIAKTGPALAIFDISLKGGVDGIELTKLVMKAHPTLRVLVLSLHDEPSYARRALAAGACGYMNKGDAPNHIIKALHLILDGGTYLTADMRRHLDRK